jgi:YD repeat-containing protein
MMLRPSLRRLFLSAVLLLASCHERGVPFPYVPNTPEKYNRQEFGLQDARVAMLTYEQYHEYYEGLASERIVCFDTSGNCVEYFYRDHDICQHRVFSYDSLGRRTEERAWEDTAGVSYDSLRKCVVTTYSYSKNGRRCKARITAPDGKSNTFRLRYDKKGHLSRFIYPDGSRFSYDYDTAGRLVCRTWPDASTERYEYDGQGELKAKINRDGTHTWYMATPPPLSTDSLGRVLEEVVGQSPDNTNPIIATYVYDDHGNWVRRTTAGVSSPTVLEVRTFRYYGI